MKDVLDYADRYMDEMDWKDMALMKVGLCSMGVVLGTSVSGKAKKPVRCAAKFLCVVTCVPLAVKAVAIFLDENPKIKMY
ncbi:permease of phosphate ABC transporter [Aminipila butyrica]|uniref:Permease of phosphate ABC transporter n=1 Tax=Aminipila butyrica TaxID=433296 RepID=A0A858BYI4_9FIRM|nr:permease of phosphate ABC transporter [Aminipila butyrica]QIB70178.1 permease of phosphate ABC transporter [Aminipila butyrica]